MDGASTWADDVAMPALLRAARSAYGQAIRRALAEAGHDDVPPNGPFVLGAIARAGAPLGEIIEHLGSSKQAAGQLVDTLVLRGYLDRSPDPDDRRRLVVSLTDRGKAAAAAARSAVDSVDAALEAEVGAAAVRQTRATLGALVDAAASAG